MANTIESIEFYNLMRSYRWASEYSASPAHKAYQAVIDHIDKDRAERDKRIVAAIAEACKKVCGAGEDYMGQHLEAIGKITPESVLADIDKQEIAV